MTAESAAIILNLSLPTSREEVEKAYRQRARLYHPDRLSEVDEAGSAFANAEFSRINLAREVLLKHLAQGSTHSTRSSVPSGESTRPTDKPAPPRSDSPPRAQQPPEPKEQPRPQSAPRYPSPAYEPANRTASQAKTAGKRRIGLPVSIGVVALLIAAVTTAQLSHQPAAADAPRAAVDEVSSADAAPVDEPSELTDPAEPTDQAEATDLASSSYADTLTDYEDGGKGVAWRWQDKGSCQTYSVKPIRCWTMQVAAYRDCDNGIRATIDVMDGSKVVGRLQSNSSPMISAGDIADLEFDWRDTTSEGLQGSFVEASCRSQLGFSSSGIGG